MKIIAFSNQKGGVAKSTSVINLAGFLGELGKKILVVDLDPQSNATQGLSVEVEPSNPTIYDCLVKDRPLSESIYQTVFKNVDIVPATLELANAELEVAAAFGREMLLSESIKNSNKFAYDYILIDLPPNLGLYTINGLSAADEVIIPVDAGIFSLSGVQQLLKIIYKVKSKMNPRLNIAGVVFTKVDSRTKHAKEVQEVLEAEFKDLLFNTQIHQNVKIAEAQAEGKPINYYCRDCKGAEEYKALAEELMDREA